MKSVAIAAAAVAAFAAAPASALEVVYTDRASFESETNVLLVEDLETATAGALPTTLPSGIGVDSNYGGGSFSLVDSGFVGSDSLAFVLDEDDEMEIVFDLGGYYTAFGLDVFTDFSDGAMSYFMQLTDTATGDEIAYAFRDFGLFGGFLGIRTDQAFDQARVWAFFNPNEFGLVEAVDNVTLGGQAASPVPLPGAFALLAGAAAALGGLRLRRRA